MKVKFSRRFEKDHKKCPQKIKTAFNKKLSLFLSNPYHSQLNNHALVGRFKGYRSINITGDWRVIYREMGNGKLALFELLGTHSQLYR